jgi:hypothetical protein
MANCPICNEEMFYTHIDNEVRWACIFCWAREWKEYKRREMGHEACNK